LSPPKHRNKELQQIIKEKRNEKQINLIYKDLTCGDMEIVGYYLLRDNTVMNILFIFILRKSEVKISFLCIKKEFCKMKNFFYFSLFVLNLNHLNFFYFIKPPPSKTNLSPITFKWAEIWSICWG
jgi:hypothetical protein